MSRLSLVPILVLPLLVTPSSLATELDIAAFENPPLSARPRCYWDWINGDVSLEGLTRDLEEMKDKGMGGGQLWDVGAHRNANDFVPAGPPFLGPESVEAIRHALAEGKRLGLELGLLTSSGWNAGGAWVTPEYAGKNAYVAEFVVEGPATIQQDLPMPELPALCPVDEKGAPLYAREIAVIAVPENAEKVIPNTEAVLDLSAFVDDGRLQWEAPAGRWRVLRFVCLNNGQQLIVASPNSKGPLIDFLDPAATRMHFGYILDRLGITPENAAESGLSYLTVESMELAEGIQWSDGFAQDFKRWRDYEVTPFLPILAGWTIQDGEFSERFLYDYHKALSEQLIFSHYVTGESMLNEYGIDLIGEAGGPGEPIWKSCPVDSLKALGALDMPQGEFWIRHRNMFLVKEVSSAAHIYGKPVVDAESFTTWRRWKDGPAVLKRYADRAFCEGLNRITFHTFAHTPPESGFPGRCYHAGVDFNPNITWWSMARPFVDYLARCSYMLQQGTFVADACYFYGDQAPNFWPAFHDVPEKPLLDGLGRGYDYDVVNSDVILNRMSVEDGHLVLPGGLRYRMMVLRDQQHMPLEVLQKLAEFVEAGATIVGPKPVVSPGLHHHEAETLKVQELAQTLWGNCDGNAVTSARYGKGRVFWGPSPREVLAGDGIAQDFEYTTEGADPGIDYIHRTVGDTEVYFVRNPSEETVQPRCTFRVSGKRPEAWDPMTGEVHSLFAKATKDGRTELVLDLAPGASVFVVFQPGTLPTTESKLILSSEQTIDGPWTVRFPPNWGAPEVAEFPSLQSWTENPDDGIKYFSGIATYSRTFNVTATSAQPDKRCYLDLGEVRDVARVRINGEDLGVVWTPPYRVEIRTPLNEGENLLEIDVANRWINRLTGDLDLPVEERFTMTNETPREKDLGGDEFWRIQPSGLLGPVKLLSGMTNETEP